MFHVQESSRLITHPLLGTTERDGNNGCFQFESPEPGWKLVVVASDGLGWEHVSVHARRENGQQRTPNWNEMCFVKSCFWDDEDVVIQFHPKKSEYRNLHTHTLHMWRPIGVVIPTPPPIAVAPPTIKVMK